MKELFKLIKAHNGINYLSIPEFEKTGVVKTAFTTRIGGISEGAFESLNMGGMTKDDPRKVNENRKKLNEALGIQNHTVVYLGQIHSDEIAVLKQDNIAKNEVMKINDTDAVVTNVPEVALVTLHADCIPVFFMDEINKVIALAHAGWRGTVQEIAAKTARTMKNEFGSRYENIKTAIGPGISSCCFETGTEVYEEFNNKFPYAEACFTKKEDGKYLIDLKKVNYLQLQKEGIKEILVSEFCTKCNEKLFFSHRRDNGITGRLAAVIAFR